jgi:hypothetical protein
MDGERSASIRMPLRQNPKALVVQVSMSKPYCSPHTHTRFVHEDIYIKIATVPGNLLCNGWYRENQIYGFDRKRVVKK